jgi:hypothetical protein
MKRSKKCKLATTNKEYKIALKSWKVYCIICNKRLGVFDAYCGPISNKKNKNWKKYRKHQWYD